ncbi:MAG: hypothetical protein IKF09_08940 [Clostridiales bacterium]|nr:hypothetical protein [Clostridiales bacterium]
MKIEIPEQKKVISTYGPKAQTVIHCEECAELIQAISKMHRIRLAEADDKDAYYNLVEEMADVLIIIAQLKEIYGISDSEIQKLVDFKCARQEARINESDRRVSAG